MLYALDLAGTAVFAVTGALAAGRKRMDLFGVLVVALVTAIGGGTVRDLVLGRTPVFWVRDPAYLGVGLGAGLAAFAGARAFRAHRHALVVADAFGLAIFTLVGAQVALRAGFSAPIAVVMGTMTAATGGLIRDVLCNEVPLILRREVYATASLAGGAGYAVLLRAGASEAWAGALAGTAVLLVRLAAIRWGLSLPVLRAGRGG